MRKFEREKICRRGALWGADIYTDDSDPLAAAMHAGWLRGDWGEGVDHSTTSLIAMPGSTVGLGNSAVANSASLAISVRPALPQVPLSGKDLHLTLLILPTLQRYASLVRYGIKSRAWGDTHDGMSFKIERMAWVDEGAGYGEERGGEARRKRMKSRQSMARGPPLRLATTTQKIDSTKSTFMSPTSG